jgi:hypothetical protein
VGASRKAVPGAPDGNGGAWLSLSAFRNRLKRTCGEVDKKCCKLAKRCGAEARFRLYKGSVTK